MKQLEFVQIFFGGSLGMLPPLCDIEDCTSRSIAMWQDETKKGYALCRAHMEELGAPEPTPGISYAPTKTLIPGWSLKNGIAVKDAH